MGNPWIVEPEEVRVELEWIDTLGEVREFWISIKKYLSIGEQRKMMKSVSQISQPLPKKGQEREAAEAKFEWTDYSFARCSTYLVDWSLRDENDNKMPLTRSSLEQLHADLFDLIDNTVDDHETKMGEAKKEVSGSRK
tara:strand:- start:296 stop:709 length:414 start_codon:yes stop_codon:yes gene_type:complete